jgi:hypothetical protein
MTSTTCITSVPAAPSLSTSHATAILLEGHQTSRSETLRARLNLGSQPDTGRHKPAHYDSTTLSSLPPELVTHIVSYLDPADCTHARLTSKLFNTILASRVFRLLPSFLDPVSAKYTLRATLAAFSRRPRSIWSPDCSVPQSLPIQDGFLLAMYVAMTGKSIPLPGEELDLSNARMWQQREPILEAKEPTIEVENAKQGMLTVERLAKELGNTMLTEEVVRAAMFRYMLFLSYVNHDRATGTEVWTVSSSLWRL